MAPPLLFYIIVSVLKFVYQIQSGNDTLTQLTLKKEFSNFRKGVPSYFDFVKVVLELIGVELKTLDLFEPSS
jgi:hypothetical protein